MEELDFQSNFAVSLFLKQILLFFHRKSCPKYFAL